MQTRPADQIFQVGTGIAIRALGNLVEIDILGERHFRCVNGQDHAAAGLARNRDVDQLIEPARTQ